MRTPIDPLKNAIQLATLLTESEPIVQDDGEMIFEDGLRTLRYDPKGYWEKCDSARSQGDSVMSFKRIGTTHTFLVHTRVILKNQGVLKKGPNKKLLESIGGNNK